uniref:Serine/threonine-protein phosphatase 1 regulatory subunit 10 n=1 Tax=Myripristis murdjan TaxID=586833 RepID=A0A668A460_9TELE
MAGGPVDPREILKGVETLLGKDGELRSLEGVPKVFSLMKASTKMVSRCMYLNILLQTKSHDILNRFIRVGGYKLLNSWLTYAKTTNNTPLLQLILLTLQKLPLKVDHLKQNNTAKLVKQLSKSGETEELRKLAAVLVDGWMAIIRSQSVSSSGNSPAGTNSSIHFTQLSVFKDNSLDATSIPNVPNVLFSEGLEMDTPSPVPVKKTASAPQLGDKYNIKPAVLKRPSSSGPSDALPVEKKYKPLNTPSNSAKEIKVKIIPAQPMECTGFLDALNSAPVPGIKIKKKKPGATATTNTKVVSPTSNKVLTTFQSVLLKPNALSEPRGDEESLTKKGKKKKSVRWAEEEQLKEYFYFDLDETERVNVNKIKDFGEAAKRELMMDRQTFEMARRLSHDTMEERVPWTPPRPLTLPGSLVNPGANSTEKLTQRDREMGILQEIFLSKESVPDSPHEPDPEPYEPMPPRLIPLDEDSTMLDEGYVEPMDTTPQQSSTMMQNEGSKLPPVLANLMVNLGNSGRSPQATNTATNPVAPTVNVQELLSSIMGAQGNQSTEELIKQPDFSDKIKQLLGSLQQTQNQNGPPPVNQGLLGHGPGMNSMNSMNNMNNMNNMNMSMQMPMNGYPPNNLPGGPRFNHPPPPHNHGPPFNAGGGPRMMGPPPGQGRGDNGSYWGDESMRGGPHRGGHFHRGGRGRGGDQGFRGRGRGGPRGGHNNMNGVYSSSSRSVVLVAVLTAGVLLSLVNVMLFCACLSDMSKRPVCRHFMMKGNCRYESNCAFYHPGVNGPPLPPNHPANNQHNQHPQHPQHGH